MRGVLFWVTSTALAFALTAVVFLMLAEIGTAPPEHSLNAGDERQPSSSQTLSLELRQSALENLEEAREQALGVTLSNNSDRELTDISVYVLLYSEDTAEQNTHYYNAEIQSLAPGESKTARFELDLSPPEDGESGGASAGSQDESSFTILEIRAASSEGASTVKTAVLSF